MRVSPCLTAFFLACASLPLGAQQGFYREYYAGIAGSRVADLTAAAAFPDAPTVEEVVNAPLETGVNVADYYGQRVRALLTPAVTGSYTFWVATDDGGELWLGTDHTPASRRRIAYVSGWASSREWTKEASQKSAAITLTAGTRYYIEVLQKENTGGDNLAVAWQVPGTTTTNVIPAAVLTPYLDPPVIRTQPLSLDIEEQWAGLRFVELYNSNPFYQDLNAPGFLIPDGTELPALGFLIDGSGDTVWLFAPAAAGGTVIDALRLDDQQIGVAHGRFPDGFGGSLANSRETVTFSQPVPVMDTADPLAPVVVTNNTVVERVAYRDGGEWHALADGGGSSLERIDPRADPALARSWAASDESQKSAWTTLEFTGRIDHGFTASANGDPNEMHIGLMDAGECLIDAPDGDGQLLKTGRYRWNWQKRGYANFFANDYANFFSLVETLNTVDPATYTQRIRQEINLEGFAGVIAMNQFIGNYDTYGFNRGKNMYLYDSAAGWQLIAWDLDVSFGANRPLTDPINPSLATFPTDDPTMRDRWARPPTLFSASVRRASKGASRRRAVRALEPFAQQAADDLAAALVGMDRVAHEPAVALAALLDIAPRQPAASATLAAGWRVNRSLV